MACARLGVAPGGQARLLDVARAVIQGELLLPGRQRRALDHLRRCTSAPWITFEVHQRALDQADARRTGETGRRAAGKGAGVSTVRYWAAARAAAGVPSEELGGATLGDALAVAVRAHGAPLEKVLSVCSYVVDGDPVGSRPHDQVALAPGSLVDVLPPFAGG